MEALADLVVQLDIIVQLVALLLSYVQQDFIVLVAILYLLYVLLETIVLQALLHLRNVHLVHIPQQWEQVAQTRVSRVHLVSIVVLVHPCHYFALVVIIVLQVVLFEFLAVQAIIVQLEAQINCYVHRVTFAVVLLTHLLAQFPTFVLREAQEVPYHHVLQVLTQV